MLSLENQINFKSTSVRIYLKIAMDVPIKIVESRDVKQYPLVIWIVFLTTYKNGDESLFRKDV